MRTVLALAVALASSAFAAPPSRLTIEYADARDIPAICAARGRQSEIDRNMAGCYVRNGSEARIIIPHASKGSCVYWHELRHVFEGDWHAGRKASSDEGCDWRPPVN